MDLEVLASLGKLTSPQIAQLEHSLAHESELTQKVWLSRLLIVNAWSAEDKVTWEKLVKHHLAEIDHSDPQLCYKYSLFLSKTGVSSANGVIRWADVALKYQDKWIVEGQFGRVSDLHQLRAGAAKALWEQAVERGSDQAPAAQERARVMAHEWVTAARDAGKDLSLATELCVNAGGSVPECDGSTE